MTPSVVQATGAFNSASGQTSLTSAAFGSSVTPGNMLIVCGYANNLGGGTPSAPTFTDSKGNTWPTTPDKFQFGVPKDTSEFMYYAHKIVESGKGGTGFTVTATYHSAASVSASSNRIFVVEVSGIDTMDGAAVLANATSATAAANFPVTAAAASYILALCVSENGITAAAPSGWVSRLAEGSETIYDQITTTTGTKSISVSAGGSNQWCIIGAVFYAAGAATPVAIAPTAAATANASVLVTAGAIEGPMVISASVAQATALVAAPSNLSPAASATAQATATVIALIPLTPTASVTAQATVSLTVPGVAFLTPTASAVSQAATSVQAVVLLSPIAQATGQATTLVTTATVPLLNPTAQASASAATAVIAASLMSATGQATSQATAFATVVPQLSPIAQATAAATAIVRAPMPIEALASSIAQATAVVTAALVTTGQNLSPTARAQAQATASATAPGRIIGVASAQAQALTQIVVSTSISPSANATAQALTMVSASMQISPLASALAQAMASATAVMQVSPLAIAVAEAETSATARILLAPAATITSRATVALRVPTKGNSNFMHVSWTRPLATP